MTTKRRYECNLCHSEISPTDKSGFVEGRGVVFGGSHVPDQPIFKFTRPEDAENHMCGPCLTSIRKLT